MSESDLERNLTSPPENDPTNITFPVEYHEENVSLHESTNETENIPTTQATVQNVTGSTVESNIVQDYPQIPELDESQAILLKSGTVDRDGKFIGNIQQLIYLKNYLSLQESKR